MILFCLEISIISFFNLNYCYLNKKMTMENDNRSFTATNPSPSQQNAMNRNSEEGLPIMKERDSIRVNKHALSCLKIYISFSRRCLKNRTMLYGSPFI